jgi:GH3 auxin-responsive promoter
LKPPPINRILQEIVKLKSKSLQQKLTRESNLQDEVLKKLLRQAKRTEFGKHYDFRSILRSRDILEAFRKKVPVFDYLKMKDEWWHHSLNGEVDITWPGKIQYFALTSGTSDASSKYVPVSDDMVKAIKKIGTRQILSIPDLDISPEIYTKSILMLGGSSKLNNHLDYKVGDLSGIMISNLPLWIQKFSKPGKKISDIKEWPIKIEEIVKNASQWDIGIISGVPSWVQLLIQKIIAYYKVENIHKVWPNFSIYVHGGVSFKPYEKSFENLLGKKIHYLDTYLASEGFFASQNAKNKNAMELVLDNGIYFEFVPFNDNNFDTNGLIRPNAEYLNLTQVKTSVDYALLVSTCSGAWRYQIGDTIKFTSVLNYEIIITGRTKQFLSICGEHLSIDNLDTAISKLSEEFNIDINEYGVAGALTANGVEHNWYLGTNGAAQENELLNFLDQKLIALNDDYATERKSVLKKLKLEILPLSTFYEFMKLNNKEGGQHKFPRVLKGAMLEKWNLYLTNLKHSKI